MSATFTDWRGNEIAVGTKILYPRGFGSRSVEIAEGIVREIVQLPNERGWDRVERKWVDDIPAYKLKVTSTGEASRNGRSEPKDVWITVFENVTAA